jgi:hypothetical protein
MGPPKHQGDWIATKHHVQILLPAQYSGIHRPLGPTPDEVILYNRICVIDLLICCKMAIPFIFQVLSSITSSYYTYTTKATLLPIAASLI